MQFLSWLLWSVKCHCCCFFSSPSWNYRSENRNYRNKQPPLQSNHLKTCKIYKYSSANANFSKSSHKGHKTKGQILKHSNDSLWTKPSKIYHLQSSLEYIAYLGHCWRRWLAGSYILLKNPTFYLKLFCSINYKM